MREKAHEELAYVGLRPATFGTSTSRLGALLRGPAPSRDRARAMSL